MSSWPGHGHRARKREEARQKYLDSTTGTNRLERGKLRHIWEGFDELPNKRDHLFQKALNKILTQITDNTWGLTLEGEVTHLGKKVSKFTDFISLLKSGDLVKNQNFLAESEIFIDELKMIGEHIGTNNESNNFFEDYKAYIDHKPTNKLQEHQGGNRPISRMEFEKQARNALMNDDEYRLYVDPVLKVVDFDYAPIIEVRKAFGPLTSAQHRELESKLPLGVRRIVDEEADDELDQTTFHVMHQVAKKDGKTIWKDISNFDLPTRIKFAEETLKGLSELGVRPIWRPGDFYLNRNFLQQRNRLAKRKQENPNYDIHNDPSLIIPTQDASQEGQYTPVPNANDQPQGNPWGQDFSESRPFGQSQSFTPPGEGTGVFRFTEGGQQQASTGLFTRPFWERGNEQTANFATSAAPQQTPFFVHPPNQEDQQKQTTPTRKKSLQSKVFPFADLDSPTSEELATGEKLYHQPFWKEVMNQPIERGKKPKDQKFASHIKGVTESVHVDKASPEQYMQEKYEEFKKLANIQEPPVDTAWIGLDAKYKKFLGQPGKDWVKPPSIIEFANSGLKVGDKFQGKTIKDIWVSPMGDKMPIFQGTDRPWFSITPLPTRVEEKDAIKEINDMKEVVAKSGGKNRVHQGVLWETYIFYKDKYPNTVGRMVPPIVDRLFHLPKNTAASKYMTFLEVAWADEQTNRAREGKPSVPHDKRDFKPHHVPLGVQTQRIIANEDPSYVPNKAFRDFKSRVSTYGPLDTSWGARPVFGIIGDTIINADQRKELKRLNSMQGYNLWRHASRLLAKAGRTRLNNGEKAQLRDIMLVEQYRRKLVNDMYASFPRVTADWYGSSEGSNQKPKPEQTKSFWEQPQPTQPTATPPPASTAWWQQPAESKALTTSAAESRPFWGTPQQQTDVTSPFNPTGSTVRYEPFSFNFPSTSQGYAPQTSMSMTYPRMHKDKWLQKQYEKFFNPDGSEKNPDPQGTFSYEEHMRQVMKPDKYKKWISRRRKLGIQDEDFGLSGGGDKIKDPNKTKEPEGKHGGVVDALDDYLASLDAESRKRRGLPPRTPKPQTHSWAGKQFLKSQFGKEQGSRLYHQFKKDPSKYLGTDSTMPISYDPNHPAITPKITRTRQGATASTADPFKISQEQSAEGTVPFWGRTASNSVPVTSRAMTFDDIPKAADFATSSSAATTSGPTPFWATPDSQDTSKATASTAIFKPTATTEVGQPIGKGPLPRGTRWKFIRMVPPGETKLRKFWIAPDGNLFLIGYDGVPDFGTRYDRKVVGEKVTLTPNDHLSITATAAYTRHFNDQLSKEGAASPIAPRKLKHEIINGRRYWMHPAGYFFLHPENREVPFSDATGHPNQKEVLEYINKTLEKLDVLLTGTTNKQTPLSWEYQHSLIRNYMQFASVFPHSVGKLSKEGPHGKGVSDWAWNKYINEGDQYKLDKADIQKRHDAWESFGKLKQANEKFAAFQAAHPEKFTPTPPPSPTPAITPPPDSTPPQATPQPFWSTSDGEAAPPTASFEPTDIPTGAVTSVGKGKLPKNTRWKFIRYKPPTEKKLVLYWLDPNGHLFRMNYDGVPEFSTLYKRKVTSDTTFRLVPAKNIDPEESRNQFRNQEATEGLENPAVPHKIKHEVINGRRYWIHPGGKYFFWHPENRPLPFLDATHHPKEQELQSFVNRTLGEIKELNKDFSKNSDLLWKKQLDLIRTYRQFGVAFHRTIGVLANKGAHGEGVEDWAWKKYVEENDMYIEDAADAIDRADAHKFYPRLVAANEKYAKWKAAHGVSTPTPTPVITPPPQTSPPPTKSPTQTPVISRSPTATATATRSATAAPAVSKTVSAVLTTLTGDKPAVSTATKVPTQSFSRAATLSTSAQSSKPPTLSQTISQHLTGLRSATASAINLSSYDASRLKELDSEISALKRIISAAEETMDKHKPGMQEEQSQRIRTLLDLETQRNQLQEIYTDYYTVPPSSTRRLSPSSATPLLTRTVQQATIPFSKDVPDKSATKTVIKPTASRVAPTRTPPPKTTTTTTGKAKWVPPAGGVRPTDPDILKHGAGIGDDFVTTTVVPYTLAELEEALGAKFIRTKGASLNDLAKANDLTDEDFKKFLAAPGVSRSSHFATIAYPKPGEIGYRLKNPNAEPDEWKSELDRIWVSSRAEKIRAKRAARDAAISKIKAEVEDYWESKGLDRITGKPAFVSEFDRKRRGEEARAKAGVSSVPKEEEYKEPPKVLHPLLPKFTDTPFTKEQEDFKAHVKAGYKKATITKSQWDAYQTGIKELHIGNDKETPNSTMEKYSTFRSYLQESKNTKNFNPNYHVDFPLEVLNSLFAKHDPLVGMDRNGNILLPSTAARRQLLAEVSPDEPVDFERLEDTLKALHRRNPGLMLDINNMFDFFNMAYYSTDIAPWMMHNLIIDNPSINNSITNFNSDPSSSLRINVDPYKQRLRFHTRKDQTANDLRFRHFLRNLSTPQLKELQERFSNGTFPVYITDEKKILVPQSGQGMVPFKNLDPSILQSLAKEGLEGIAPYNLTMQSKRRTPYNYDRDPRGHHFGERVQFAEDELNSIPELSREDIWPFAANRPEINHQPRREPLQPGERYTEADIADVKAALDATVDNPERAKVFDLLDKANRALNNKYFNDERKIEEWFWNRGVKGMTLKTREADASGTTVELAVDPSLPLTMDDMVGKLTGILPEFIEYISTANPHGRPDNWSDVDEFTNLLSSYDSSIDQHNHLHSSIIKSDYELRDRLDDAKNPADRPIWSHKEANRLIGTDKKLNVNPAYLPYVNWKLHSVRRGDLESSKQKLQEIVDLISHLYGHNPQFENSMHEALLKGGANTKRLNKEFTKAFYLRPDAKGRKTVHLRRGAFPGDIVHIMELYNQLIGDGTPNYPGILTGLKMNDLKILENIRKSLGITKDDIAQYAVQNRLGNPLTAATGIGADPGIHKTYLLPKTDSGIRDYVITLKRMLTDISSNVPELMTQFSLSPTLTPSSDQLNKNFHNELQQLHDHHVKRAESSAMGTQKRRARDDDTQFMNEVFPGLDYNNNLKNEYSLKPLPQLYSGDENSRTINEEWAPLVLNHINHLKSKARNMPSLEERLVQDVMTAIAEASDSPEEGMDPTSQGLHHIIEDFQRKGTNFTEEHKNIIHRWLPEDAVEKFHKGEYEAVRHQYAEEAKKAAEDAKRNAIDLNELVFKDKGISFDGLGAGEIKKPFQVFVQQYFLNRVKHGSPKGVDLPLLWYLYTTTPSVRDGAISLQSKGQYKAMTTVFAPVLDKLTDGTVAEFNKWKETNAHLIPKSVGGTYVPPPKVTPTVQPRVSPTVRPPSPIHTATQAAAAISRTPQATRQNLGPKGVDFDKTRAPVSTSLPPSQGFTQRITDRIYHPTDTRATSGGPTFTGSSTGLPTSARFAGTGQPYSPASAFRPAGYQRPPVSSMPQQLAPDPNRFRQGYSADRPVGQQIPMSASFAQPATGQTGWDNRVPASTMFRESPLSRAREGTQQAAQPPQFKPVERYNLQAELKKINDLNAKMQADTAANDEAYFRRTEEARQASHKAAATERAAEDKNLERAPYNRYTHLNDLLKWWRDEGAQQYKNLEAMSKRGQPSRALLKEALDWARTRPQAYDLIQHDTNPKRDK